MAEYSIYKGAGKTIEFKGLKSQYLIGFFIGVFVLFILFVILRVTGAPIAINLVVIGGLAAALVWYVFTYNKKYGRYGLMKRSARNRQPRFILRRKSCYLVLKQTK
jgi:hypothetical protein